MNVFVSGGSGFIGSHLIDRLLLRGHKVISFDTRYFQNSQRNSDGEKNIEGNILDKNLLEKEIAGCDFVFHLAGKIGTHELIDRSIEAAQVNIIGTLNVLEACRKFNIKFLLASKLNCWLNTYTITKIAAEDFTKMYRHEHGVEAVILKLFNVYGERQALLQEVGYRKMIPTSILQALRGEEVEIYGDGTQTMDLIYISDVVKALTTTMDNWKKCEGRIFEIGTGDEIAVNDAVKMIMDLTNSKSNIAYLPMRKGEGVKTKIKADITGIKIATDWSPKISVEEGLKKTIRWCATKI